MNVMEKRSNQRTNCFSVVDIGYKGQFRRGFIKNLSPDGVFIEIPENLDIGETIVMTFKDPFFKNQIKTSGEVVWNRQGGFGIKFIH